MDAPEKELITLTRRIMNRRQLSDREREGLRGPVKICSDLGGDKEYAADGRLLVLRGFFSPSAPGTKQVSSFSYDEAGTLISITCGSAKVTQELHYDEQGRKTIVRTVPPNLDDHIAAITVDIPTEVVEGGGLLRDGGRVTTRYNDDDQPIESLVHDAQGKLRTTIVHNYAKGQLISETLVWKNSRIAETITGAIFRGSRQLIQKYQSLQRMERSFVYNDEGRVSQRLMRMGNVKKEERITYNEHGDETEKVNIHSGSLDPRHADPDKKGWEARYLYQYDNYDNYGNWTKRTMTKSGADHSHIHRRTFVYY
jgi:hypothetical protein